MPAKPTNGIGGCSNPIENRFSARPYEASQPYRKCVANMVTLRFYCGRRSAMICQCQERLALLLLLQRQQLETGE